VPYSLCDIAPFPKKGHFQEFRIGPACRSASCASRARSRGLRERVEGQPPPRCVTPSIKGKDFTMPHQIDHAMSCHLRDEGPIPKFNPHNLYHSGIDLPASSAFSWISTLPFTPEILTPVFTCVCTFRRGVGTPNFYPLYPQSFVGIRSRGFRLIRKPMRASCSPSRSLRICARHSFTLTEEGPLATASWHLNMLK
jgi:hypothetical protein